MRRFIKGLSYTFDRNIGKTDRAIRTLVAIGVLILWILGVIAGWAGTVLGIFSVMILGTAASARCGVTYWMNSNTMSNAEKRSLKDRNIRYE